MGNSYYDVGIACLNGHAINGSGKQRPQHNAKFCSECGQSAVSQCKQCGVPIRGDYKVDGFGGGGWQPPSFCHECGTAYPWTEKRSAAIAEAIDEMDELEPDERKKLKDSIPDILSDTPATEVATSRFKKAAKKAGSISGKVLYDTLIKVATEAVVKSMGM